MAHKYLYVHNRKRILKEIGLYNGETTTENKTESWRDTKCRKCKSIALNYGKEVLVDLETNKVIKSNYDNEDED